jgi:hypothetical protein
MNANHRIARYRLCLIIVFSLLLSIACNGVEQLFPTPTPYPTLTPYPTQTPYPTYTPYATLTPYPTQTPYPTYTPYATLATYPFTPVPTAKPPDLAGSWRDNETRTIHTIRWQDDHFVVVSSIVERGEVFQITAQSWRDGILTWTYYVPSTKYSVTFKTVALSGDNLRCSWSGTAGAGFETLSRVR